MQYAKAYVAAAIAGLTTLGTALTPDNDGVVAVTAVEWVAVAVATLTALGAVWAVKNKPAGE